MAGSCATPTGLHLGPELSCLLGTTDRLACWGRVVLYPQPGALDTPARVADIAYGGGHFCMVATDGRVFCNGDNLWGELGDGTTTTRRTWALVPGITARRVVASFDTSCAILTDDTVACWGRNREGTVGIGDSALWRVTTPRPVVGLGAVTDLAAGRHHICAVRADRVMVCWGSNILGELGLGTTTDMFVPTVVPGLGAAARVGLGDYHTCVVLASGELSCWGANASGQLADGTITSRSSPVSTGVTNAASVDLGSAHTCALLTDGTVRCAGYPGTVGDGSRVARVVLTDTGLTGVTEIATGNYHSCALLSTDRIMCWGANGWGQVTPVPRVDQLSPVLVPW